LKIAAKEADYPEYCLLLCEKPSNYPASKDILTSLVIIKKSLNVIISTMKNKR
jgi:hypothetical protein